MENKNYCTVQELIEKLQSLPQDAICTIMRDGNGHESLIEINQIETIKYPYFAGNMPSGVHYNEDTEEDELVINENKKVPVKYVRIGMVY